MTSGLVTAGITRVAERVVDKRTSDLVEIRRSIVRSVNKKKKNIKNHIISNKAQALPVVTAVANFQHYNYVLNLQQEKGGPRYSATFLTFLTRQNSWLLSCLYLINCGMIKF